MKNNSFLFGCNYWASDAGVYMWRRFNEASVQEDFRFLSDHGVDTVRVFPVWQDFQPITDVKCETSHNIRIADAPLPSTALGAAGIDEEMMRRFSTLLDLAEKYRLKVIVSILTGWMSGRLFFPPALANRDIFRDPLALRWEIMFIRTFVDFFKNRECIIAWEPGNECNCMSNCSSPDESFVWLSLVCNTIRAADPSRPIYAGMHGLTCNGVWRIQDVSAATDMLTTHPYPLFTPYCATEKLTELRPLLHAAAESFYYSRIGNKNCLAEEAGTLGPMVINDADAAQYAELSLLSVYAYSGSGFLWWCAFDQDKFDFAPYDSFAIERNLGFATAARQAKPVLKQLQKTKEQLRESGDLSGLITDGVVILSREQDDWAVAYSAFLLALQAGLTIDFQFEDQPLKDKAFYILPCVNGTAGIPKKLSDELKLKVTRGASLLITYDEGYIGDFENLTGLTVTGREKHSAIKTFELDGETTTLQAQTDLLLKPVTAQICIQSKDGNILLSKNKLGNGSVYFLNAPLEKDFAHNYRSYDTSLYKFYKQIFTEESIVADKPPKCGVTRYEKNNGNILVLFIFYDGIISPLKIDTKKYNVSGTKFCSFENGEIFPLQKFCMIELSPV